MVGCYIGTRKGKGVEEKDRGAEGTKEREREVSERVGWWGQFGAGEGRRFVRAVCPPGYESPALD